MSDKPQDQSPDEISEPPLGTDAPVDSATFDALELATELAAAKDALLRAHADMENLRKRTAREVEDARRYAVTGFARDLLEVSDNLSRAVAFIPPEVREREDWAKSLATGVEMTERALLTAFEKHKISRVEPAKGDKFDHQRHQAMFEVPTDALPPGTVAEIMATGYVIADRLLRPAMVGVAKAPAPAGESTPVDETA